MDHWEDGKVHDRIGDWISLKMGCSDQFSGFVVSDILESLLLQKVQGYVQARNGQAIQRLGKLAGQLDEAGLIDYTRLKSEISVPLICPKMSLLLHETRIVDIGTQLDTSWAQADCSGLKTFSVEMVKQVLSGSGVEMITLLVATAFDKDGQESRRKKANVILERILRKLLGTRS